MILLKKERMLELTSLKETTMSHVQLISQQFELQEERIIANHVRSDLIATNTDESNKLEDLKVISKN